MKKKISGLLALFICMAITVNSQPPEKQDAKNGADTASVNTLLQQSKERLSDDPNAAISLAMKAKELAEKINFVKGEAYALKNIGLGYYYQSKYAETLDYWNQSLKIFESLNDQIGVANLLNNIGAIYTNQGVDAKGLEYSLKSLEISEKTGDKLRILSALNSIGTIYYGKSEGAIDDNKKLNWDKALEYFLKALPLCEELGNNEALGIISENTGEIYFKKGDDKKALAYYNKSLKALGNTANSSFAYNGIGKVYLREGNFKQALTYHNKALAIAEKLGNKINTVQSLQGIANVYNSQNDYTAALDYYNKAGTIAKEIKSGPDLKDLYRDMAVAYNKLADYKNAFKYQTLFSNIKDTLYNIDNDKKLGRLQFDFDLQKKQGEINLLTKDKALTDLKLKRQRFAKNVFMGGLAMVFMIALLIFRNYRIKVKTNKILDHQKAEIENLLLNILPSEVANELQVSGQARPRYYESVSVLFTDFKGFTMLADKMTPQELLQELNSCFMAFDEIIEKNNLEKIKTIGDSYMCAGGIPTPDDRHVENIIKAGMEIRSFINRYNDVRKAEGLDPWELRIGIHVGPVVAGVVGKKKYAYDIWGTTVNIASRMENNGEPGQVNISSHTYDLIKDKYSCSYRGKIFAKNIGEIDMYFVEGEADVSAKDISLNAFEKEISKPELQIH